MEDGLWQSMDAAKRFMDEVLILVLMEDGLWQTIKIKVWYDKSIVLILVLMEDGLWQFRTR